MGDGEGMTHSTCLFHPPHPAPCKPVGGAVIVPLDGGTDQGSPRSTNGGAGMQPSSAWLLTTL